MKYLFAAFVYIALSIGANADIARLEELRGETMRKLAFHAAPVAVAPAEFTRADGAGMATLADYRGRYVLLNFWATWCAPCRKEMPMFAALQAEFGGPRFEVLTLATGRNAPAAIARFFEEIGIDNLPRHQDPRQAVARAMQVPGLPTTVLLDPEGREIARMVGDADWYSDDARAIVAALLAQEPG
ncbi:MAG: TlpA family protein disulfide reductase [Rhodobacteraceae bacterium]|nr:TlpA family protein disulfide reductase [Paracoccaceae bacterium]